MRAWPGPTRPSWRRPAPPTRPVRRRRERARVMSLCTAPAQEESRNDSVAMESREGEAAPERPAGEGRRERRARAGGRGGLWRGSRSNPRRARTQMPDPVAGIKIMGEEKGGLPAGQVVVSVGPPTNHHNYPSHIIPTLQQGKLMLTAAGRGRTGPQFNLNAGRLNHCPLQCFLRPRMYQALGRLAPSSLGFGD